ncbi:metalloprotease [Coprinopsis cinerea AmutBmut pab1-1]|nr:metalloprotease [Coprinopsis cinerea AmutBmut pab1-1]
MNDIINSLFSIDSHSRAEATPANGCPIGRDTCPGGGPDPVQNYMDYSYDSCVTGFSQGQITRLQDQLATYRLTGNGTDHEPHVPEEPTSPGLPVPTDATPTELPEPTDPLPEVPGIPLPFPTGENPGLPGFPFPGIPGLPTDLPGFPGFPFPGIPGLPTGLPGFPGFPIPGFPDGIPLPIPNIPGLPFPFPGFPSKPSPAKQQVPGERTYGSGIPVPSVPVPESASNDEVTGSVTILPVPEETTIIIGTPSTESKPYTVLPINTEASSAASASGAGIHTSPTQYQNY